MTMKDYRIPLVVALPAAIGLIGVLWLVHRSYGSGDKGKKLSKTRPKEKKFRANWSDEAKLQQAAQHVEKESITVSERKIPETLARDRGSSDLQDEGMSGSPAAGRHRNGLVLDSATNMDQCSQDSSLRAHTEHPKTTGDEKDLPEPLDKLSTEFSESPNQDPADSLSLDKLLSSELVCKTTTSHLQMPDHNCHLQKMTELNSTIIAPETEFLPLDSVIHCPQAVESDPLSYAATIKSYSFASMDETQTMSSNSKAVHALTLMDNVPQDTIPSVEQSHFLPSLQATLSSPEHATFPSSEPLSLLQSSSSTEQLCEGEVELTKSKDMQQTSTYNDNLRTDKSEHATEGATNIITITTIEGLASSSSTDHDMATTIYGLPQASPVNNENSLLPEPAKATVSSILTTSDPILSFVDTSCVDGDRVLNQTIRSSPSSQQDMALQSITSEIITTDVAKNPVSENDQGIDSDSAAAALSSKVADDDSPAKSSSPAYDSHSEGSNDSGRGGSEHDVTYPTGDTLVHFDFNMPLELCGRFIGKHGKNINYLKSKTGVQVSLTNNPYTPDYQVCQIVGSQTEVDDALAMIRRKFPLKDNPLLTMAPLSLLQPSVPAALQPELQLILPDVTQLSLPEGVSVDVFVSAIVDAGHVFVQQPTHRSFMSLEKLNYFLNLVYNQESGVPYVPSPVESGTICVCEHDGFWYRGMTVTPEDENGESQVKFVDYGGYSIVPVSSLKQIRADLMSLPFQAVECFLANIAPKEDEQLFSEEATQALSDMTRDKLLQCQVVARTETGVPYIHLYQIFAENNSAVMINQALANSHLLRWVEFL